MNRPAHEPNRITRGLGCAPRNAWYVVAGIEEVGETLLSRRVMGVPLVLYRTADGTPVALHDRCPHRLMPLSLGTRIEDRIQCLYHGFEFDAQGSCTLIPSQKGIPDAMCVRRYTVVERAPYVWIWMGDPGRMDPALIPDPGRVQPHYSQIFHFCYPIKSDFMLMHENLMDTSHPTYLHAGYFDDGQLAGAPFTLHTEGNLVRLVRDVGVHVPGPGTTFFFNLDPGRPVHQTTITETYAPSLNVICYQFRYPDQPERPMIEYLALAPITPVSERECYHFVASCFSWPMQPSPEMHARMAEIIKGDQLALEAIEERRDEMAPGEHEIHVRADGPSLHLRRLMREMVEAERNATQEA